MSHKAKKKSEQGFIALMSAIIISMLLIMLSLAVSMTGFFGRFNILDAEYKQRSLVLAEACADSSLLKLITIPDYAGNETINLGADSCYIFPITAGATVTIKTQATYQQAVSILQTSFNGSDYSLLSWQELTN